jgi:3-oxoadipate enol-lactonase
VILHHEISGPESAPVLLMGGSLGTTLKMWDVAAVEQPEAVNRLIEEHLG